MRDSRGFVTVNDEPTKSRLYRFCEKKIGQWLQDHLETKADQPVDFKVRFTQEEDTNQIGCVTEISCAGSTWVGYDLDHDTQQAFMHSLKHLHTN